MKKFLILFAMIFAFSLSINAEIGDVLTNATGTVYSDGKAAVDSLYHDGKTVVGTVYNDAKTFGSSIYPDVKEAVVSIGKAIGVAAEHVYGVLVKKYIVIGVKQLMPLIFGIILVLIGYFNWRKVSGPGQVLNYRMIVPLIFIITGILTCVNVNYDDMLMGLINPEYGAINYILDYTKEIVTK